MTHSDPDNHSSTTTQIGITELGQMTIADSINSYLRSVAFSPLPVLQFRQLLPTFWEEFLAIMKNFFNLYQFLLVGLLNGMLIACKLTEDSAENSKI